MSKKVISLLALLIPIILFAQVPQGISYQAIALNGLGNPVVSSNVGIRLSILDNSASGTVLYSETQTKTTNAQGLFNLVIGQGTTGSGTFGTINWRTNSKFLKVEMDANGGSNYVLVGSTQLLSVPYALAADSLITSPGEGITLVSPNGTPYQVTVNDSGQLSLPTSGMTTTVPGTLFMYGSFNSFDPTSALTMSTDNYTGAISKYGYKYLTAGTQLKFLSNNDTNATVYGVNAALELALNGSVVTIPSTGFYYVRFFDYNDNVTDKLDDYSLLLDTFAPELTLSNGNGANATYNSSTNVFSFIANNITNISSFTFQYPNHRNFSFGDSLGDGTLDYNGPSVVFPGATSIPKNYRIDLIISFSGNASYTITQI